MVNIRDYLKAPCRELSIPVTQWLNLASIKNTAENSENLEFLS